MAKLNEKNVCILPNKAEIFTDQQKSYTNLSNKKEIKKKNK